jgi:L-fucose mutarotase
MPLDTYMPKSVCVMDRVESDKTRNLEVKAYAQLAAAAGLSGGELELGYIERFHFYEMAKTAAVIVQTDDKALYANAIIFKGVI